MLLFYPFWGLLHISRYSIHQSETSLRDMVSFWPLGSRLSWPIYMRRPAGWTCPRHLMVSGLLYLESRDEPRRIVGVSCYMMIQYPYLAIHWLQSSFQGRFCFDFCPFFCKFVHFKLTITISIKKMPLHVFILKSCWVCPGISAFFLRISALSREFPPRKIDTFLHKVEQNQPKRYEIQSWPQ